VHARDGPTAAFIAKASGAASSLRGEEIPRLQCRGTASVLGRRTRKGARDGSLFARRARGGECGAVRKQTARVPRRQVRRGSVARASRQWGRVRTDAEAAQRRPSRQGAWRAGGALERDRPVFQPVNPSLTLNSSKNLNCASKKLDRKVVDNTSLYNIFKGCPMFFSTV
jgi:hypothetical protein